jgi:KipI family sensor histidine kinase inhibitor
VRVVPFGERALLVELGEGIDPETNARVQRLFSRLMETRATTPGLGVAVPAYASLMVPFDPDVLDAHEAAQRLQVLAAGIGAGPTADERPPTEVPVHYGDSDGPDLAEVAERTGLSTDEVVATHAGTTYRVYMLGFAPGFAYLGTLPEALRLVRRAEPRVRVPAGSVAIASSQTAVYPFSTAGGWHLIGRTELQFWDGAASSPSRLRPGDRVRFVAV